MGPPWLTPTWGPRGLLPFYPTGWTSLIAATQAVEGTLVLSTHLLMFVLIHQGLDVQIWQTKSVYRCPKNYLINREFGM